MEPMRTAVVLNPRAAGGRAGRQWTRMAAVFERAFGAFTLLETRGPGGATVLAAQALEEGCGRIVSAGGDGTHHEVINGFFDGHALRNPEAVLAVLPLGTGSDLARTLELPPGPACVEALRRGRLIRADVCRAEITGPDGAPAMRYYINSANAGIGAEIAARVNRSSKRLGGFLSFLLATAASLVTYRNCPMSLSIDGVEIEQVCCNVFAANGRYDGGGMYIAPDAALDSGYVEALVLGDVRALDGLRNLRRLYNGTLRERTDLVQHFRARRLRINAETPVPVCTDGEVHGRLPAEFEVLPGAVRLITAAAVNTPD